MAEAGKSLQEICSALQYFNQSTLASVGVSFGSIALPDSNRFLFDLPAGQMELGLGVHGILILFLNAACGSRRKERNCSEYSCPARCSHRSIHQQRHFPLLLSLGEAGIDRIDVTNCETIISSMGSMLLGSVDLKEEEEAVVMVNNLGSMTQLEMGIICKYVVSFFGKLTRSGTEYRILKKSDVSRRGQRLKHQANFFYCRLSERERDPPLLRTFHDLSRHGGVLHIPAEASCAISALAR